jgi:hypothetical protein
VKAGRQIIKQVAATPGGERTSVRREGESTVRAKEVSYRQINTLRTRPKLRKIQQDLRESTTVTICSQATGIEAASLVPYK